jgi:acyl transferase domain-containing protein
MSSNFVCRYLIILLDELSKDGGESNINQPWLSQAACTALQVAIIDLLDAWKIVPSRVVGHSSGELAAAYCVRAITRESAWRIAYFRGVLANTLIEANGAMLAVGLGEEKLKSYLDVVNKDDDDKLVAACINSPKNVTVSGAEQKIDALKYLLDEDQVFCRKLNVNIAYHSARMNTVAKEYARVIGNLPAVGLSTGDREDVLIFSSVTGLPVTREELSHAQYWVNNLTNPVQFAPALSAMCSKSHAVGKMRFESDDLPVNHLLEIGPHSALQSIIKETLGANQELTSIGYSSVLARKRDAIDTTLAAVGQLFCRGFPVDLNAVNNSTLSRDHLELLAPKLVVDLPPYSFNRSQTHWIESRLSKNFRFRKYPRHDLLGAPVADWNVEEPRWRQMIRISELPWLNDHKGSKIFIYWHFKVFAN